jgi:hypothetical protein
MITYSAQGGYIYTPQSASFLMDLMANDALLQRIKDHFGEDTADVLSFVSKRRSTVLSPEAADKLDTYWRGKVETFLVTARNKIGQLDATALTSEITHAEQQIADKTTD